MLALIATLVMILLVLLLLFPGSAQELLMARVPVEIRPDPDRLGMKLAPTVAIFVFGFAMFRGWDQLLHRATGQLMVPLGIAEATAIVFLIVGLVVCILSPQVIKRIAPRVRDEPARLRVLAMVIQILGVTSLLVAVQLFRHTLK